MHTKNAVGIAAVLAVAALSAVATTTAGSDHAATTAWANAGNQHNTVTEHGMGLDIRALTAAKAAESEPTHSAVPPLSRSGEAPASFDLSEYALPAGDQGKVGSCVTWATGYTGYGILMNEQKIKGAPMAPMFIYSQIAKGNDNGTFAKVALPMEQEQGIDTKDHYTNGDFDFTTQPTQDERDNAAHYKLSGFNELPTGDAAKAAIMDAVSQGMPVAIGFSVHQSFRSLTSQTASDYSYLPGDSNSDPVIGGHEVTIVGYNDQGVKIENSWASGWGADGYFTVPWSFFSTGDVDEINAMGKLVQS